MSMNLEDSPGLCQREAQVMMRKKGMWNNADENGVVTKVTKEKIDQPIGAFVKGRRYVSLCSQA